MTEARILLAENLIPLASLPNLCEERRRFDAAFPAKATSSQAAPSAFSNLQQNAKQKIVWSRPPAADATVPVTLLHPLFRKFVDDCENHHPISSDNDLVRELMAEMSIFFPDENKRAAKLREIMTKHGISLDTYTVTSKGHHFLTDGAVVINGDPIAILEVKGEIGSAGAEPYAQVVLYYTHSTLRKAGFSKFNFPALLITHFGQTPLSFHAIILTECSQDRKLAFLALYGQLDPISKFLLRPYLCFVITPTRICVNLLLVILVP